MERSGKLLDAAEVAKHNSPESCWVILYGHVYDVTEFLPSHPGGTKIILKLAGKDATEDFDPVHPPGTLEEFLKPADKLGAVDPSTVAATAKPPSEQDNSNNNNNNQADAGAPLPLDHMLNLDDMEAEAHKRLAKKAWAYYWSASDDMVSKRLNAATYADILLRPRFFVDCTACDTATTILGYGVSTPIFVAPAAMARLAHPDGELGIARAAASYGALQIVSNNASMTPEQIVADAAPGQIFGWQLYVQHDRARSENMLRRINAMRDKYKFIVLTLDAPVAGKREPDERANLTQAATVEASASSGQEKRPGGGGIGQQLFHGTAMDLTWKPTLAWLAAHTELPIVLKGISTWEDARLAAQCGPQVKGIILSNHGGRALDGTSPPVHVLLEMRKYCPEVFERIEVYVDGGIRRGTDVVKALCLGAKAVGVGRAALYGLGVGGQAGVERAFEILQDEVARCMRLLGAKRISDLGPQHLNSRRVERDVFDMGSGCSASDSHGLWAKPKPKPKL